MNIKAGYLLEIKADIEIYKDHYKDGQLGCINSYEKENDWILYKELNKDTIKEFIKKYIEENNILESEFNFDMCEVSNNYLMFSEMVNDDGYTPSEEEKEKWKQEEIYLYDKQVCLYIEINKQSPDQEELATFLGIE